jgi:hypothetical protein
MNRKDPSEWSPSYAAKNRSKRSNGEPPYWFIYRDKQRDLFEFPIKNKNQRDRDPHSEGDSFLDS